MGPVSAIDEVRISDIARSADWIKIEYYNQSDPANFYDVGDEEAKETGTPNMKFTKTATLAKDADGDGVASPGDTIKYTATMTNVGNAAATGVTFSDTTDVNTRLVVGTVTTTQGSVLKGNLPGENSVEVDLGDIPMGSDAVITFDVTINKPLWVNTIANQGLIEGTNVSSTLSDDPTTPTPGDPTILSIQPSPSPSSVPGLSLWGNVALALLFGGVMVWLVRRRLVSGGAR